MKFYVDQKYPVIDKECPIAIYTYNIIRQSLIDDDVVVFDIKNHIVVGKRHVSLKSFK